MTQKFLESDEVDSKIFRGRVMSLLGQILQNQDHLMNYLEDAFHVPKEHQKNGEKYPDMEPDYDEDDDDE